jgi:ParB family transcriptional regulator, chromosome partitioning protein
MSSNIKKKLAGKTSKLAEPKEQIKDHPASLDNYSDGSFFNMDVNLILPNPYQPRKFFDEKALNDLTKSIKDKGVIQPIVIRKDGDKIFLVAGERRLRATKKAKLKTIPAILTTGNPIEISLIENLQRDNLKPLEEAEALAKMVDEHKYTQQDLATVLGKGRSTITETLSLNKLPEDVKVECRHADIYPRRLLVEVAKQKDEKQMTALFKKIKKNDLKSTEVRKISRENKETPKKTPAIIFSNKIQSFIKSLAKLDIKTVTEDDAVKLKEELRKLGVLINIFLE